MAYLSIEEFKAMGGAAEDANAFARHEMKARRLIDRLTHGRIQNETPVRDAVKMCMHDLIRAMAEDEALAGASGREVSAVSNDGISVSYAAQNGAGAAGRYTGIVRAWLDGERAENGVQLLYCGVDA